MTVKRSDIERQLGYLEAMQSIMEAQVAWNRQEGDEGTARHCAGVAEGLGIAIVTRRCILEKPLQKLEGKRVGINSLEGKGAVVAWRETDEGKEIISLKSVS